jgi:hypothetical protein
MPCCPNGHDSLRERHKAYSGIYGMLRWRGCCTNTNPRWVPDTAIGLAHYCLFCAETAPKQSPGLAILDIMR